jgi:hypothetical protein
MLSDLLNEYDKKSSSVNSLTNTINVSIQGTHENYANYHDQKNRRRLGKLMRSDSFSNLLPSNVIDLVRDAESKTDYFYPLESKQTTIYKLPYARRTPRRSWQPNFCNQCTYRKCVCLLEIDESEYESKSKSGSNSSSRENMWNITHEKMWDVSHEIIKYIVAHAVVYVVSNLS